MFVNFLLFLFVLCAHSTPTSNAPGSIGKRALSLASSIQGENRTQIKDGFAEVLNLAKQARFSAGIEGDPIFKKYFKEEDREQVINVYGNILGDDETRGNALLNKIIVTPDYADSNGEKACVGKTGAVLRGGTTSTPIMVICDNGYTLGVGNKNYANVRAVTCDSIGNQMSWDMYPLKAVMLHEFTHWKDLVVPPLSERTNDLAYGPYSCANLDKSKGAKNADSYAWYAVETFWSAKCNRDFAPAVPSRPLVEDDSSSESSSDECSPEE